MPQAVLVLQETVAKESVNSLRLLRLFPYIDIPTAAPTRVVFSSSGCLTILCEMESIVKTGLLLCSSSAGISCAKTTKLKNLYWIGTIAVVVFCTGSRRPTHTDSLPHVRTYHCHRLRPNCVVHMAFVVYDDYLEHKKDTSVPSRISDVHSGNLLYRLHVPPYVETIAWNLGVHLACLVCRKTWEHTSHVSFGTVWMLDYPLSLTCGTPKNPHCTM
jgi:hypothetical protein